MYLKLYTQSSVRNFFKRWAMVLHRFDAVCSRLDYASYYLFLKYSLKLSDIKFESALIPEFYACNNNKENVMIANQILQDAFLKQLHKEQVAISIFLVNGIKLHGVIENFDQSVIMLKSALTQMVYKHAISTVVPSRLIETPAGEGKENMAD